MNPLFSAKFTISKRAKGLFSSAIVSRQVGLGIRPEKKMKNEK
jgi:hypothetical protein